MAGGGGAAGELLVEGPVVKGFGVGGRYIAHPYYSGRLGGLLGCRPFPGTLNFRGVDWRLLASRCEPLVVPETLWEGRRLGAVYAWRAVVETVDGPVEALVIRPLLSRHEPEVLEVVACQRLAPILPDGRVRARIRCTARDRGERDE